jgi:hypothetical protein
MMKKNYIWNFELSSYTTKSDTRLSKVMTMLDEVRKHRDDNVSNKKKVQMDLVTDYQKTKSTMAFAST